MSKTTKKAQVKCEYLKEENCTAVSMNDEGQATRQEGCENNNKNACCYVCPFYHKCEISCAYLGERKCPLCGSEMYHARLSFRIGGWEGFMRGLPLGMGEIGQDLEELLPMVVYVCSKCGKSEFFADEKAIRRFFASKNLKSKNRKN